MTKNNESERIAAFIARWEGIKGGAERANYQIFVGELCDALDLPRPGIASGGELGDYQYEAPVPGGSIGGGTGFIDVYRRNHFILEAKQSKLTAADRAHPELFDVAPAAPAAPSGVRYDQLMRDARRQAERYAHSLPGSHDPVPFLIVADVGRAFELFFDYAGNGRGYGFFPDKQRYRIGLTDLASDEKLPGVDRSPADILRAIWLDPASIDPRVRAADVTRDVARKLAQVSLHLEDEGRRELKRRGEADAAHEAELIEGTALFLMRILFCMFAEDVGLLPKDRFTEFLQSCVRPYNPDDPGDLIDEQTLRAGLVSLWQAMDSPDEGGRYAFALRDTVRYFNGGPFGRRDFYRLARNDLDSLIDAARHRWTNVEPAIFGTLLEQALSSADRAKLGAHYTPRPYVERLVQATITDVLAPDWAAAQDAIAALLEAGDAAGALARATGFLKTLQAQRVLDPACGTGNFLYVAMETLLRLEADVIETIAALGGVGRPTIGPHQFLGLELNPRAAVIAELVLWIGWLRWRTANDPAAVPDPVLRRTAAINFGATHGYDAILARDEAGEVVQPPQPAAWPEAEFIVGNPPFIGKGAAMRSALGSGYVEDLWTAYPAMPRSADVVMFWWDRAADLLVESGASLRRFGLVTTNSITGSFNRRVLDRHLSGNGVSLVFAVPDHPWTKAGKDAAAVRIAMTVGEAGSSAGELVQVVNEAGLATDSPELTTTVMTGVIHADLTTGSNVGAAVALRSNLGLSANGMLLAGRGFVLSRTEAEQMVRLDGLAAATVIRPYVGGSELVQRAKDRFVVDLFGLTEKEARNAYPATYQHVLATVKPIRDVNNRSSYRNNWWTFAEPRKDVRPAMTGLNRYVATVETSKHRIFRFVTGNIVPDHMVIAVATEDAYVLGVLSCFIHLEWALRSGAWLGVGNDSRYSKSKVFDPFPFPDPTFEQRAVIADLGEELDETRKRTLVEHPRLTMTGLYNLVEKLRAGATLTAAEEVDARDGRVPIIRKLHDDLDQAVADAYGWGEEWRQAPLAPAEIVARLVALNAERAAEEKAGHVRWLRPDYQIPRFASTKDVSTA